MKVVLDTDIGSDIDDAVCLAYLLAQPECELLGITTVTGEAVKRAMIASALCRLAGKADIPIYPGAETPLLTSQQQQTAPQAEALAKWPDHQADFAAGEAVEFLRQTIHRHPHEVTLLTIGPLTNIALLFATDPAIPTLLQGLVIMGGEFFAKAPRAEWNIKLDPQAATIVYRAQPPLHRSIGLDVTTQVTMPADEVRQRFDRPLLRAVVDFAEVWFRDRDRIVFHDPLAAVTLFDHEVCSYRYGQVLVNLDTHSVPGRTLWDEGARGSYHEAADRVDARRFFERFFSVFSA
jgi:purine nucleosidase